MDPICSNELSRKMATSVGIMAMVLAITGTAYPAIYTYNVTSEGVIAEVMVGIFRATATVEDVSISTSIDCSEFDYAQYFSGDTDDSTCENALRAKCAAAQGLAIAGILAIATAIGLSALWNRSGLTAVASFIGSMSCVAVWAIFAQEVGAQFSASSGDCGISSLEPSFGASFFCFIVASVLSIIVSIISITSGASPSGYTSI
eukprot:m.311527 g.311527  ORF g.311527 m.311527 type:complete len:203 (-) comp20225_c1_seq1:290-898(-)